MKHRPNIVKTLSVLAVVTTSGYAQGAQIDQKKGKIDEIFSAFNRTDSPGCAVAVYQNGELTLSRAYGMADLQQRIGNSTDTVFHIASVSKQFTAHAINLLVHDGALALDDKVRHFIPQLPAVAKDITLRQLLYHTSGLRDELELLWMAGWRDEGDVKTLSDVLNLVQRQQRLNNSPGATHLYINTGYTLLAEVVRRVSGQSLRDFARERIFRPLAMHNTQFVDDSSLIVGNRAVPYQAHADGGFRMSQRRFDYVGAMGLHTTVEDLAKWERNLLKGSIGGAATVTRMSQAGRLPNGTSFGYGMGMHVGTHRGVPMLHHDGVDSGFRSTFVRFPEQKVSVATLCNHQAANTALLSRQVAEIFLASALQPAAPPAASPEQVTANLEEPDRYTGWFVNETNGIVREVRLEEGRLQFSWGKGKVELLPIGPGRFRRGSVPGETRIKLNATGHPTQMIVSFESGDDDVYTYLGREPFRAPAGYLARFEGSYFSPELDAGWRAVVKDDNIVLEVPRNGDLVLRPLGQDRFGSTSPFGFFLEFTRSQQGNIEGFLVSNPRVKALRFQRSNHP